MRRTLWEKVILSALPKIEFLSENDEIFLEFFNHGKVGFWSKPKLSEHARVFTTSFSGNISENISFQNDHNTQTTFSQDINADSFESLVDDNKNNREFCC